MTVAATGLNEKSAKDAGIDFDKTYIYSASHAGYYPGASNMSIKALWDKKDLKIIGTQIVGFEGVDKRMDVIASAMRLGAKISDLKSLEICYDPPFSSAQAPVNMLGYVAENVIVAVAAIAAADVTFVLVQITVAEALFATLVAPPCPAVTTVKGRLLAITPAATTETLVAPVTAPLQCMRVLPHLLLQRKLDFIPTSLALRRLQVVLLVFTLPQTQPLLRLQ